MAPAVGRRCEASSSHELTSQKQRSVAVAASAVLESIFVTIYRRRARQNKRAAASTEKSAASLNAARCFCRQTIDRFDGYALLLGFLI